MKVIEPAKISTFFSTVLEDEYPLWSPDTSYAAGVRVLTPSTHQTWQSVQSGNSNHNPINDDGLWWILVGATDRYKPFDKKIGDRAVRDGDMQWTLTLPTQADGLALFGIGAATIRVRIVLSGTTLYDVTHQVIDTSSVTDWYSFFTYAPVFESELILTDLPGFAGAQLQVTFSSGGGQTSIGEIVAGRVQVLGTTLEGSSIGITDYSLKDRDEWGNPLIVERAFADTTTFTFAMPPTDGRRVKRLLASLRATPAVYFADADTAEFGTTIYGFFNDFDIPLTHGMSFANLEIEGLV